METFGDFILNRRTALGHKRIYVAQKLAVSAPYVRDIELGNRPAPHSDLLLRLLSILEIDKGTPEYLVAIDLAAETRNDIPLDIKKFLMVNQKDFYDFLRRLNAGLDVSDGIENLKNIKLQHTEL